METFDRRTAVWLKSPFSADTANCVEVSYKPDGGVAVRDSKHPDGPILHFTDGEWGAFVRGVVHANRG